MLALKYNAPSVTQMIHCWWRVSTTKAFTALRSHIYRCFIKETKSNFADQGNDCGRVASANFSWCCTCYIPSVLLLFTRTVLKIVDDYSIYGEWYDSCRGWPFIAIDQVSISNATWRLISAHIMQQSFCRSIFKV